MIRPATAADIPFLLDIARHRYTQAFDEARVREFLAHAITAPSMLVLRGERGGLVASIVRQVWGGPLEGYVQFVAALPSRGMIGEGVALVRAADQWRRRMGAETLRFGEETGVNMAALARRFGAVQDTPSYVIRGGQAQHPQSVEAQIGVGGSTLLDRVLNSPLLPGERPALRVVGVHG